MIHHFKPDGSHYNGGAVFFGYGYRAAGEPRFKLIIRWYRQGERRGKSEDHYFVDGVSVESYEAALTALETSPVFTPEEIAALALIGDEAADLRKAIDIEIRVSLHDKGAIEYGPPGHFRRTDSGKKAIECL